MMGVLALFGIGGVFSEEFVEDRRKTMVPPGLNLEQTKVILADASCSRSAPTSIGLERQLADGRAFLLGSEPSLADLSAFHPLLLLRSHPRTAALLAPLRRVPAWSERVRAIGHGKSTPITSARGDRDRARRAAGRLRGRAGAARGHAARPAGGDPRRRVRQREPSPGPWPPRASTRSPCGARPSARARWWCTSRARTTAWSRRAEVGVRRG